MMEGLNALAIAFAAMLALFTTIGTWMFNDLRNLKAEKNKEGDTIRSQRDELQRKVDDQAVQIAELTEQVKEVPALKRQVQTLVTQLETMQTSMDKYKARLDEAEQRDRDKQIEINQLRADKAALEQEKLTLVAANSQLSAQINVLQDAFKQFGVRMRDLESRDSAARATAAEPGEGAQEVSNDG